MFSICLQNVPVVKEAQYDMSRYGTDYDANNLYSDIIEFLENHKLSELLSIVIDAIEVWESSKEI